MPDAGIICVIIAFFSWQFYKHRKAILHNMKLYGNYFASVMNEKVDKRKKKNETKKQNERR